MMWLVAVVSLGNLGATLRTRKWSAVRVSLAAACLIAVAVIFAIEVAA